MTLEEFKALKVGDTVYYSQLVNIKKIGTVNAAIKVKVIRDIFDREDGSRGIGFEHGGVLLKGLLHLFETDRTLRLRNKIQEIKRKMMDLSASKDRINSYYTKSTRPPSRNEIEKKYLKILEQKNVQKMLDAYPELLI